MELKNEKQSVIQPNLNNDIELSNDDSADLKLTIRQANASGVLNHIICGNKLQTVEEFKMKLSQELEIPIEAQRLITMGREMKNSDVLGDFSLCNASIIHLFVTKNQIKYGQVEPIQIEESVASEEAHNQEVISEVIAPEQHVYVRDLNKILWNAECVLGYCFFCGTMFAFAILQEPGVSWIPYTCLAANIMGYFGVKWVDFRVFGAYILYLFATFILLSSKYVLFSEKNNLDFEKVLHKNIFIMSCFFMFQIAFILMGLWYSCKLFYKLRCLTGPELQVARDHITIYSRF